ncbi:MAG: hypothetical protein PQJ61_13260 [Spirochaetales bacterium]|uniref:Uncharacterized protein n=1 Tax=Candidatus Thalassospirochaeta sargassi TaxID=3119039 RepID=A0AAJ1IIJ5_9SPIO|nr:hypothetical protein [Spirochaetales bacterium]
MSREVAIAAFASAQCMRNRFTVLDLAYDLGVLFKYINKIQEDKNYLY